MLRRDCLRLGLAFGASALLLPERARAQSPGWPVPVEIVSTAVPWPRGIVWLDGELIVLARGRHRSMGGTAPGYDDKAGYLFRVDPRIAAPASYDLPEEVRTNARVYIKPTDPPFRLYQGADPPTSDTTTDRPYCTLARDPVSGNFFICGYSGLDLKEGFRKNATDSVLRYDPRRSRWYVVDRHDPAGVPPEALGKWVDDRYYPHADPSGGTPPPHGLVNGPDNACVVGRYLYVAAKDNSVLARYDLTEIRGNPDAPPPRGEILFGDTVKVRWLDGSVHDEYARGQSAVTRSGDWLYVGYRTTSQVLRFPLDGEGDLRRPVVGEKVAQFDPWDPEAKKSADLQDLQFDKAGNLYATCAARGRVWRFRPDPRAVFDGTSSSPHTPFVDLRAALKAGPDVRLPCGNMTFDPEGNLYVCAEGYGGQNVGTIYRIRPG